LPCQGYAEASLVHFFAGNELNDDYGNWFGPSAPALVGMCRSAGFRSASIVATEDVLPPQGRWARSRNRDPVPQRLIAHALV
jgi:hypothetical protein